MGIVNRRVNRAAIEALHIRPADEILELGFGPGDGVETLAALAPLGKVYGIDQSPVMLDMARRRNRRAVHSGHVVLKQGSFDNLPLPDASVDKILAVNVVYFWADASPILKELKRVLRPSGLVSIYATEASTMRHWKFAGPETHRIFNCETLTDFLRIDGFDSGNICVSRIRTTLNVRGLIATARRSPVFPR